MKDKAMETTVELLRNPNPAFGPVAAMITKGPEPEWLILGLEHFSLGIAGGDFTKEDHQKFVEVLERMEQACDTLIQWLPVYKHMGFGVQCPEEVWIALQVLPLIKADLPHTGRKIGRRPDTGQGVCAAVIVEAWKLCRGKVAPRSEALYAACQAYWRACGGAGDTDDQTNWRWNVEQAIADDNGWIRQAFQSMRD
jgi:hypothetical protein